MIPDEALVLTHQVTAEKQAIKRSTAEI